MVSVTKLFFDPALPDDSSNVGAYLRGEDGTLLTHTTSGLKQALDVNVVLTSGQYAEDAASASGDIGNFILAVRHDADTSLVDTDGDYGALQLDALGRLKVAADISVVTGFEKAEDSAHTSGDIGGYILGVIQGTLSASASDNDYGSIKTDLLGRTWVNRSAQSASYGATSIATSATDIITVDLANRVKVIIQNIGGRKAYVGSNASVTAANGIELTPGSSVELEVGPSVNLHAIAVGGATDFRYFECA